MTPQRVRDRSQSEERRVIPLVTRAAWQEAVRDTARDTARDWVAWTCLGLGILCGAGAVYFALTAMVR